MLTKLKEFLASFAPAQHPSNADIEREEARLDAERQSILNHAYGIVSRGNRAAGLAHIEEYITAASADVTEGIWFFNAMTRWEHSDAALAFGRDLIGRLLRAGMVPDAHKVLLQCEHLDARFLPRPEDQIPLAAAPTQP